MDLKSPALLFLLALVPLWGGLTFWLWRRRLKASAAWASRALWSRLLPGYHRGRPIVSSILLATAILGIALALVRPRWGSSEIQVERQGVDVVFVLDSSLSMATRDVQPDRFWVAQTLIRRLARELREHRVALVQAEGDGVVMVPLTSDGAVIELLLDAMLPASLPTPGTDLARALERALDLLPTEGSRHQVLVLLSDGEDHGTDLLRAASKLRQKGVVAHTIGVGTHEGKPLELPRLSSRANEDLSQVEYKRDEEGQVVVSRLIEENLRSLSRETEGVYLMATSPALVLDPILERIEDMETRTFSSDLVSTLEERFQWPLGGAVLALALHLLIAPFRRVETPS